MTTKLVDFVLNNEERLMDRVLFYAQRQGYTKYTSSLKEAWRISVSGLTKALIEVIQSTDGDLELTPDEDHSTDAATQFGNLQAQRHKERGVPLDMFLGLMKYYRQAYQDLIEESAFDKTEIKSYKNIINRYFDRIEIGFCKTWAPAERDQVVKELQSRNRQMTNEKNKYLTIFESLSMPIFWVDKDGKIENMNHCAANIFYAEKSPGKKYYEEHEERLLFEEEFPWMADVYREFLEGKGQKSKYEKIVSIQGKYFHISFSRSLDISGKFTGTIVVAEDITTRKNLENELEKFASTDPLTGAKNRRSFLGLFEIELARSQRYGHPLALLMLDIDHFKQINDSYGHDFGDRVLKLLVTESLDTLRASDLFCRWGGEEFVALLPETDPTEAATVTERLRTRIEQAELIHDDGGPVRFTVSIGYVIAHGGDCEVNSLLKTVDNALYEAKKQGRNRVCRL